VTRGLFAFLSVDIAQLKSTSVVTRGHNRLRKGSDLTEVNREGFERARNLPADFERSSTMCTSPFYGLFELIVSRVYFYFQIQSYIPLLTVRRLIELTRNPVFVFKSCGAILITIRTRILFDVSDFLYRNFIRIYSLLKIEKLQQIFRDISLKKSLLNIIIRFLFIRFLSLNVTSDLTGNFSSLYGKIGNLQQLRTFLARRQSI